MRRASNAMKAAIAIIMAACLQSSLAAFTDEHQVYEEMCLGEGVWHCADGGCITAAQHCDGYPNCRDSSDETFCPSIHYHVNGTACDSSYEFSCRDQSRCVPYSWICNGIDECPDGSDETECKEEKTPRPDPSSPCKAFQCRDGGCISWLWVCDGTFDCKDKSDENNETVCRENKLSLARFDILNCEQRMNYSSGDIINEYACPDRSFCLHERNMCDGIIDCRNGWDEGAFCKEWPKMCDNHNCSVNSTCRRTPTGQTCECDAHHIYDYKNNSCADRDECIEPFPRCSHVCVNAHHPFRCLCDEGYTADRFSYLCFAPEPEPLLFFSTHNEIRYYKVRSRQQVTVVSGLKKAHGVSYDGTYVYWVESADGHQAIVRAKLENAAETKHVVVAIGLEDPGDVAVDWLAKLVYFSDAERGHIAACYMDGGMCTILNSKARHPRFVTLHPQMGEMFWVDYHNRSVIMRALMDGSESKVFMDQILRFPSGLTIDPPNERLYFADETVIVAVRLDGRGHYILVDSAFHHPYAVAVFENTVFFSDWISNTLQSCDKVNPEPERRRVLATIDAPIMGMFVYHQLLQKPAEHGCIGNNCSDLCLLRGDGHACACPEGRRLVRENLCAPASFQDLPQFLVVGAGHTFTRIRHGSLGSPEVRATTLDIGRVQAMAFNIFKRNLYIYDGQRKTINFISMNNFSEGITRVLEHQNLDNVVDMDYDYVSDNLYFVDAGRRVVEVLAVRTGSRAVVHRFADQTPISLCVIPDYGLMMVAVVSDMNHRDISVESMGLDGKGRRSVIKTGLKGPHIRLRHHQDLDQVFISDEGTGSIDYIHPTGTGKENFRQLSTTVTSLAVSDNTVYWTDRRTPRLFWSSAHETAQTVRRIDLGIFPNHTQLHLQTSFPFPDMTNPLMQHPCFRKSPCSHVCVQIAHPVPLKPPIEFSMGYTCLCPAGLILINETSCESPKNCPNGQVVCGDGNCVNGSRCDGVKNCKGGEDELDCKGLTAKCSTEEQQCKGLCISKNSVCTDAFKPAVDGNSTCNYGDFKCNNSDICLPRWLLCDGSDDCPDGSDEDGNLCDMIECKEAEFQCATKTCIWKSWQCDGSEDCPDGSDEVNCANTTCSADQYRCSSGECIELSRRCDHHQDCIDYSDEEQCDDDDGLVDVDIPECAENEYTCQLNRSICLPISARCNTKVDCPGATDELGCDFVCKGNPTRFQCEQEHFCISRRKLCDGNKDCYDGSDESPWNCPAVKTLPPRPITPGPTCAHGYSCASGQCVEWRSVCDQRSDCFDRSDEGDNCFTACENSTCDHTCQPTPYGAVCQCQKGYNYDEHLGKCLDVDECKLEECSQKCQNLPGSFVCSCFQGFTLTMDRRHCKAIKGHVSILYVNGDTVKSAEPAGAGAGAVIYRHSAPVQDIDINVREQKLYSLSLPPKELIETQRSQRVIITNVGLPTKVGVDWVTGNVYFVDSTPDAHRVRLCNFQKQKCTKLQQLPSDANVTAFIVDPANNRMFYCLTQGTDSVIWSSTLSGRDTTDLGAVEGGCQDLAADPFRRRLYVAEKHPPRIALLSYEGDGRKIVLANKIHLMPAHRIAVFEDHLYYMYADSLHVGRCPLRGGECEPYAYRVLDASSFALRHESAQPLLPDQCKDYKCSALCVVEDGPQCICEDGTLTKDGSDCAPVDVTDLPLFNGYLASEHQSVHWSTAVLVTTLVLLTALLIVLLYFFLYKPRRDGVNPIPVRFMNRSSKERGVATAHTSASPEEPTVEIGAGAATDRQEFINPLQYVRAAWRQSFQRRRRPMGTTGLVINEPRDGSDSSSDMDTRDTRGFLPRTN